MTDELKRCVTVTIEWLDMLMEKEPSRELADCCNYLTELLSKKEEE